MNIMTTYRGRPVTDADVTFIQQLMHAHPTLSRRALSRKLREAWSWRQPNGRTRDMVCRGLMLQLHRAGHIELPPRKATPRNPLAQRCRPATIAVVRIVLSGPDFDRQPKATSNHSWPERAHTEQGYGVMARTTLRVGSLFQGRFKAILVEGDSYCWTLSRYIHLNPVRASMVQRPDDYPWRSYRHDPRSRDAPDWLDWQRVLAEIGKDPRCAA